jgi:hypothetical protein
MSVTNFTEPRGILPLPSKRLSTHRSDAAPYKLVSTVAGQHFDKVCARTQGGEGWSYTVPADLIELWPDIKVQ